MPKSTHLLSIPIPTANYQCLFTSHICKIYTFTSKLGLNRLVSAFMNSRSAMVA